MNYSSDAADQVVRLSLNGIECAAKLSGQAAKRIAALMYSVLKDQKKTRGKTRLTAMLKSGNPIRVLGVRDEELQRFCTEAKKYGVLYCVLKDRTTNDGITDVFIRAEDASKVNRIYERFKLTKIEMANVKTDIAQGKKSVIPGINESEPSHEPIQDAINSFINDVVQKPENESTVNPQKAPTATGRQSGPFSKTRSQKSVKKGYQFLNGKPSVRLELKKIKQTQIKKAASKVAEKAKESIER